MSAVRSRPRAPFENQGLSSFARLFLFFCVYCMYTFRILKCYGIVSREFVNYLQKEGKTAVKEGYDKFKYEFINNNLPNDSDSQIQRAINKFAMVAYAGELATSNRNIFEQLY